MKEKIALMIKHIYELHMVPEITSLCFIYRTHQVHSLRHDWLVNFPTRRLCFVLVSIVPDPVLWLSTTVLNNSFSLSEDNDPGGCWIDLPVLNIVFRELSAQLVTIWKNQKEHSGNPLICHKAVMTENRGNNHLLSGQADIKVTVDQVLGRVACIYVWCF